MSRSRLVFSVACALLSAAPSAVRADEMDLALSRLSTGPCQRTLGGASDFALQANGEQLLQEDDASYAQLISQLSTAVAPSMLAPVSTGGPAGFDIAVETNVTDISQSASYWERGTRGSGAAGVPTCDGRNTDVAPVITTQRLRITKGLPLGLSLGATWGKPYQTTTWLVGAELKLALAEGLTQRWAPDVGVRFATNMLVGVPALTLASMSMDLGLSKSFVARQSFRVVPFVGAGALWTLAQSGIVDLTPNVDATRCAAGLDVTCNARGLGASDDDIGHDRAFRDLSSTRFRGFVGVWLRYRSFAFAAEASADLVRPHLADAALSAHAPRQWTVSFAPSLSF